MQTNYILSQKHFRNQARHMQMQRAKKVQLAYDACMALEENQEDGPQASAKKQEARAKLMEYLKAIKFKMTRRFISSAFEVVFPSLFNQHTSNNNEEAETEFNFKDASQLTIVD